MAKQLWCRSGAHELCANDGYDQKTCSCACHLPAVPNFEVTEEGHVTQNVPVEPPPPRPKLEQHELFNTNSYVDQIMAVSRERIANGATKPGISADSLEALCDEIDKLRAALNAELNKPHAYVQKNARSTSVKAAETTLGSSGSQRVRIMEFILDKGEYGAIDDEVAIALDMMPPRVATRRGELTDGGWVVDSGLERKTRNEQDAVVWVASEKAKVWKSTRPVDGDATVTE